MSPSDAHPRSADDLPVKPVGEAPLPSCEAPAHLGRTFVGAEPQVGVDLIFPEQLHAHGEGWGELGGRLAQWPFGQNQATVDTRLCQNPEPEAGDQSHRFAAKSVRQVTRAAWRLDSLTTASSAS